MHPIMQFKLDYEWMMMFPCLEEIIVAKAVKLSMLM